MKSLILIILLVLTCPIYAQDDNIVDNYDQYERLHKYLMNLKLKENKYIRDTNSLIKDYENTAITLRNLKTDSILVDKKLEGVYSFGFASTVDKLYLGFMYLDGNFEYLDMEQSFDKKIERINKFLNKCCKEFSLEEKIKTMYKAVNVLYYYHFGASCEEVIITHD